MKKILAAPIKILRFAITNEMYGIVGIYGALIGFIAVWILKGFRGALIGIVSVTAADMLIKIAVWCCRKIGGETRKSLYGRIQKREKRKQLINYLIQ